MFLGLDLGTTNVKAVVVAGDGKVLARDSSPVKTYPVNDLGVEQDIEEIWSAARKVLTDAAGKCDGEKIRAIGVSSQGGAMQILDSGGRPAGRVISWLDRRGREFDEKLTAELGPDWFGRHIGHRASGLTTGQLLRLRAAGRLPESFRLGFVGDRIVRRLCGRAAHDPTSLSLAMLYNPSRGKADAELLERLGLDEGCLPALSAATEPAGTLLPDVAAKTHLPPGVPVSPAVHDQYASALCAGAVDAGDVMLGTGTAWVLLSVSDELPAAATDDAWVCTHVIDGRYGQILSLRTGGSAVAWACKLTGLDNPDVAAVDKLLKQVPPGSEGVRFLPHLAAAGAGPPAQSAACLAGLRPDHTPRHVLRAVVEGLACELGRYLRLLARGGAKTKRLVLCGAAAASTVTPQIIADVTGLTVERLAEADTSALGAAMIARATAEPATPLVRIVEMMRPPAEPIHPGPDRKLYAALLKEYLALLPAGAKG